jgi:hypothetical protein
MHVPIVDTDVNTRNQQNLRNRYICIHQIAPANKYWLVTLVPIVDLVV